jgi:hypothetical protein
MLRGQSLEQTGFASLHEFVNRTLMTIVLAIHWRNCSTIREVLSMWKPAFFTSYKKADGTPIPQDVKATYNGRPMKASNWRAGNVTGYSLRGNKK